MHLLSSTIDKLAGGVDEFAEALLRPGIEIIARVDWKFTGPSEGWASTDACIFCECRSDARNAIGFAKVACCIGATQVIRESRWLG